MKNDRGDWENAMKKVTQNKDQ